MEGYSHDAVRNYHVCIVREDIKFILFSFRINGHYLKKLINKTI